MMTPLQGEIYLYILRFMLAGPVLREGQAPHFGGLAPPLFLTIRFTNIQLNYYIFNQYFIFSTKKYP